MNAVGLPFSEVSRKHIIVSTGKEVSQVLMGRLIYSVASIQGHLQEHEGTCYPPQVFLE